MHSWASPNTKSTIRTARVLCLDFMNNLQIDEAVPSQPRFLSVCLVSGQSLSAKLRTSLFNRIDCGRLDVVEYVIEFEFLPFESTHLMKRKNVDALHVSQAAGEFRDRVYVVRAVCQARHQNKAQPNRLSARSQPAGKIQN